VREGNQIIRRIKGILVLWAWMSFHSTSFSPGNVESIKIPLLVMGMTGGYECLGSETIYENAGNSDKTLAFVEGATQG
jgi:hypothetical protein